MAGSATQTTGESDATIEPPDETHDEQSVAEQDVFDVLSNARRRYALQYLFAVADDGGDWPTLRKLARHVAAQETGVPLEELDPEDRRRVQIAFHQTHLPTLEDHDIVDYDSSTKTVALTDRAETVRPYLDLEAGTRLWTVGYIGLGGLSVVIGVIHALGVPPVALVGGSVWLGILGAMLVMLAGVQAIQEDVVGS